MKKYTDLIKYHTLLERFRYLKIGGKVGEDTFGSRRWINQNFYKSREWKIFRNHIILRDCGLELGLRDMTINGPIYIHHINPITENDIIEHSDALFDEENVISCSFLMHQAIHYANENAIQDEWYPREPNDTIPWK